MVKLNIHERFLFAIILLANLFFFTSATNASRQVAVDNNSNPQLTSEGITYTYKLVTSTDDVIDGGKYLITYDAQSYVMGPIQNNRGTAVEASFYKSDGASFIDMCSTTTDAYELELIPISEGGFYIKNSSGYLRFINKNDIVVTDDASLQSSKWNISKITQYGTATISNVSSKLVIRYSSSQFGAFNYDSGNIQLYRRIETPAETVSVPLLPTGYGTTYYKDKNLTVPDGVEVFTCKLSDDNTKLVCSTLYLAGSVIPAGSPVVIYSSSVAESMQKGSVDFEVVSSATETVDANNILLGMETACETTVPNNEDASEYYFYKLSRNASGDLNSTAFYWGTENGGPITYPTGNDHKAYLALKKDVATNVEMMALDNSFVSHIANMMLVDKPLREGVYSLQGVKMGDGTLPKGIYIKDGKKIVLK